MTHAPFRGGLTRRRALAGAAWSAPAVAASATAPAYAASDQVVAVDYGVFTQAFNTTMDNPNSTFFGLDSYHGQLTDTRASRTTKWEGLLAAGGARSPPAAASQRPLRGCRAMVRCPAHSIRRIHGEPPPCAPGHVSASSTRSRSPTKYRPARPCCGRTGNSSRWLRSLKAPVVPGRTTRGLRRSTGPVSPRYSGNQTATGRSGAAPSTLSPLRTRWLS